MKSSTPAIDPQSSAAWAVPGFFIHSRCGITPGASAPRMGMTAPPACRSRS